MGNKSPNTMKISSALGMGGNVGQFAGNQLSTIGGPVGAMGAPIMGAGRTAGTVASNISFFDLGDPIMSMIEGGPEIPDPPTPEAEIKEGSEGIRRGEMDRQRKRRALGQLYLTKGQDRDTGATLGGQAKTLG